MVLLSNPASIGLTSMASASVRVARNRSASRSRRSSIGVSGIRPAPASRRRSRATAIPPIFAIWRSRMTRSGELLKTASLTSWPRSTSITNCPGPVRLVLTWSLTQEASAATRILVTSATLPAFSWWGQIQGFPSEGRAQAGDAKIRAAISSSASMLCTSLARKGTKATAAPRPSLSWTPARLWRSLAPTVWKSARTSRC